MGAHVHRLESLERSTGEAVCRNCGPVKARWVPRYNGYRCPVAYKEQKRTGPNANDRRKARRLRLLDGRELICEICTHQLTVETANLDHDHKCCPAGAVCEKCVRGVLCTSCNVGLGLFRDDPELLRAGARYLETNQPAKLP